MADQITNYQCPACTGPLHFASGSGKLACDYCGSVFEVAEIEALYAEKDAAAAEASAKAEEKAARETEWETISGTDWGADAEKMRAYVCPSCGAELICDETTAATSCPYCGNPTVVPGQFAGALKPDYVIPFKLDREAAKKALKNHYRKNPFLPRTFSASNHIEEIKGVYVPFWLFDATVEATADFHATRVTTRREGNYRVTTTMHFHVRRGGTAKFQKVPADASSKMPDEYMDSIEPYDFGELKPFSTAYLPGYLADKYDVSAKDSGQRIDSRCKQTTAELLKEDVTGYVTVAPSRMSAQVLHGTVHYALLPVWLLNTKWNGKNYLFAMNGQTGKFAGELPSSKGRFWALTGILTVVCSALIGFSGLAMALAKFIFA